MIPPAPRASPCLRLLSPPGYMQIHACTLWPFSSEPSGQAPRHIELLLVPVSSRSRGLSVTGGRSRPLCLACMLSTNTLPVRLQLFAELYQCPEILIAHHKQLNNNDVITVSRFEEGYRRVGYISPWDCTSKRLKKLVRKPSELCSCKIFLVMHHSMLHLSSRIAFSHAADARVKPV